MREPGYFHLLISLLSLLPSSFIFLAFFGKGGRTVKTHGLQRCVFILADLSLFEAKNFLFSILEEFLSVLTFRITLSYVSIGDPILDFIFSFSFVNDIPINREKYIYKEFTCYIYFYFFSFIE